jgi:hypothetical protein
VNAGAQDSIKPAVSNPNLLCVGVFKTFDFISQKEVWVTNQPPTQVGTQAGIPLGQVTAWWSVVINWTYSWYCNAGRSSECSMCSQVQVRYYCPTGWIAAPNSPIQSPAQSSDDCDVTLTVTLQTTWSYPMPAGVLMQALFLLPPVGGNCDDDLEEQELVAEWDTNPLTPPNP